ncbi:MAG: hypothetical protein ABIC95_05950 [archaeon]
MVKSMRPHDVLANLIANLALSVSTTESPVAENGLLKRDYGYNFDIKKFREEFETIFGDNFRPSDGFLNNSIKKKSITVECKSYIDESDDRFKEQLLFYGKNDRFKEVFINDDHDNEILVVCFDKQEEIEKIISIIEEVQQEEGYETNIVVWVVSEPDQDGNHKIKKVYGNHTHDQDLETKMSQDGFLAKPIKTVLFNSPESPENVLVAEITKRLLSHQVQLLNRESLMADFIQRQQNDSVLSDNKMKSLVRCALRIFPEVGELSDDTLKFRPSIRYDKIQKKISKIESMTSAEYRDYIQNSQKGKKSRKKEQDKNQQSLGSYF